PFGWIDSPPGVNRMVGLYWLSDLFYPTMVEEDLRTTVRDFYQAFYGIALTDRPLDGLIRPAGPGALATRSNPTATPIAARPAPAAGPAPGGVPGTGSMPAPRPPGGGGLPAKPPGGSSNPQ